MKKVLRILPFLLFVFTIDRFMFLPGRMDGVWQYENGLFMGDPITFDDIQIVNNFKVQVVKGVKLNSCYLLGCYFGNLYLLDEQTLKYSKYSKLDTDNLLSN